MRYRKTVIMTAAALICLSLFGCQKKEEETGPVEEILTAITLDQLTPGNFYVKSGESYYLLPIEDANFEAKEYKATNDSMNGMTDPADNRLLDFTLKDAAIPTLYKNDQLIYVSNGSISEFKWERFKDYGYSIGLSGLETSQSGKIKSGAQTTVAANANIQVGLSTLPLSNETDLTVDKINGTAITSQYVNDAGVITGMSKDATAQIEFYLGTAPAPITTVADTRYFKSFELYQTTKYSLSTDGYAVIEVPSYFKSGYYLLNDTGFVKFLNVDRGIDESGIVLDTPYYYEGSDGDTLTFYEWQEANGITSSGNNPAQTSTEKIEVTDYQEKQKITIDSSQQELNISVAYKYISDETRNDASKNGKFPRIFLMDPVGNVIRLEEDESQTYGSDNQEGYVYLVGTVDGPAAGEWYLLYDNFENTYKSVDIQISSGNATSYLHNSTNGSISIYYDASPAAHDFTITWENADRAVQELKITAPDGTVYSKETTPGNIMADEYGKFVIKVPNLITGSYKFELRGEKLGRVWVDSQESVSLNTELPSNDIAEGDTETAAPSDNTTETSVAN
mgnify:CR=1 FL=1